MQMESVGVGASVGASIGLPVGAGGVGATVGTGKVGLVVGTLSAEVQLVESTLLLMISFED